jgi:ABC-type transport system involved in multi-copper enzyme maturation permease subunit
MPPVLTFARLTVWEASRRRLLLALVVLTLIVIGGSGWGFTRLWTIDGATVSEVTVRLITSQLLILLAFMYAGTLALSSVFVAAPSISGEIESGLAQALLARPVRRLDFVLGKWLGLASLIVVYAAGTVALELLAARWATGYVPPHPVQLFAYLAGVGLILLSLALLLSTRLAGMTAGIVALVAYFISWVGGIVAGAGQAFDNEALKVVGTITNLLVPTDGVWRGAVYALEPASVVAAASNVGPARAGNPFLVADPPAAAFLAWAAFWVIVVLALSVWSLYRREV